MSYADLHLHTRYSDGAWSPAELVRQAKARGFAAIAVTDHDTLDAIPESLAAGNDAGLEVIPGVEITCRVDTQEIHLLGYFFGDTWQDATLRALLEHSKRVREQRTTEFVNRLNSLGIELSVPDVLACSDCGTVGRPHVAMALVNRGVVKSTDEAFERFLKRGRPGFVDRYRMSVADAIGHIKRAGGVAVLAHPALNRVDTKIPDMVEQGLDGLEIWHSRHSASQIEHYRQLAVRFDLLVTGGSDCHGPARGEPLLGAVRVPLEHVEALRERAARVS